MDHFSPPLPWFIPERCLSLQVVGWVFASAGPIMVARSESCSLSQTGQRPRSGRAYGSLSRSSPDQWDAGRGRPVTWHLRRPPQSPPLVIACLLYKVIDFCHLGGDFRLFVFPYRCFSVGLGDQSWCQFPSFHFNFHKHALRLLLVAGGSLDDG